MQLTWLVGMFTLGVWEQTITYVVRLADDVADHYFGHSLDLHFGRSVRWSSFDLSRRSFLDLYSGRSLDASVEVVTSMAVAFLFFRCFLEFYCGRFFGLSFGRAHNSYTSRFVDIRSLPWLFVVVALLTFLAVLSSVFFLYCAFRVYSNDVL